VAETTRDRLFVQLWRMLVVSSKEKGGNCAVRGHWFFVNAPWFLLVDPGA
jgi:hypothetical protein